MTHLCECVCTICNFTFSYWFLGQIFGMEILTDLHALRYPVSKNRLFSFWSLRVSVISITQKKNYSRNFKFDILHLHHMQMPLETFYKHQTKTLCTGVSNALRPMEGISCYWIFVHLDCIKYNKIAMLKNMWTTK